MNLVAQIPAATANYARTSLNNVAVENVMSCARHPDDLVVWEATPWGGRRVSCLRELRVAAALFTDGADDILQGTYDEDDSSPASLLDLAVRFGHREFAAELARRGAQPCELKAADIRISHWEMVRKTGTAKQAWQRTVSCFNSPEDRSVSISQARAQVDTPATHLSLAALTSGDLTALSLQPDVKVHLLDAAILLGNPQAAAALSKHCPPYAANWEGKELMAWNRKVCEATEMSEGRAFLFTITEVEVTQPGVVEAALCAGVDLSSVTLRLARENLDLSLLDAAIFSGNLKLASALSQAGVKCKALPMHGNMFLGLDGKTSRICLNTAALKVALACHVDLSVARVNAERPWHEAVSSSMVWQIGTAGPSFSCWQCASVFSVDWQLSRDQMTSLSMLDAAILLGQKDCASLLAKNGVVASAFIAQDPIGVLGEMRCQRCGITASIAASGTASCKDAAMAALRDGYGYAFTSLTPVLRQWTSQCCPKSGVAEKLDLPASAEHLIVSFAADLPIMSTLGVKEPFAELKFEAGSKVAKSDSHVPDSSGLEDKAENGATASGSREDVRDGSHDSDNLESKLDLEEEEMTRAMSLSEQEALQLESADISAAVMRSKVEAHAMSQDDVVIFRLTRCCREATAALLNSSALEECRCRVTEAGCELLPAWAGGAKLLVPLTSQQILESGLDLQPYHILALRSDESLIRRALFEVKKKQRPKLKAEWGAVDIRDDPEASAESGYPPREPPSNQGHQEVPPSSDSRRAGAQRADSAMDLVVERTFIHFSEFYELSEASEVACSAPCSVSGGMEPTNPRRWKMP